MKEQSMVLRCAIVVSALLFGGSLLAAAPCAPSPTRLCLAQNRFQVEVSWRDFASNVGVGQAVPITADTGYFWFFNSANVELIVKVLDGRGLNNHFWVFFGALSNVEYRLTVIDTTTGATKEYLNPLGQFASVGDTSAFPASEDRPVSTYASVEVEGSEAPPSSLATIQRFIEAASIKPVAEAQCEGSDSELVVANCRFRISVAWKDFQGGTGVGHAVPLTSDTGYFWFFNSDNVEIVIKVLDARSINGHHWVFFGALSNVEYTITVTDLHRGVQKTYTNPSGRFASVGDTAAFHPPSFELIDLAESTGVINSETALLYRVYSLFGDSRLPAVYRGDDSRMVDSLYLAEVVDRFPTLSPETQHAVWPFLIPPVYAGSWAARKQPAPGALQAVPPTCEAPQPGWGWVDTSNGFVRIWYQVENPAYETNARLLAAAVDNQIWPKFSEVMGSHLPLSDLGQPCNGGSGRLDVYNVPWGRSDLAVAIPYTGCKQSPAFILMKPTEAREVAAHEIFHAFQFSFPLRQCMTHPDYQWWTEGSATWAMDLVYPGSQKEHGYAPALLSAPEQPLDTPGPVSLEHPYATYLLPFLIHRKTGSAQFVRVGWEQSATQAALEGVDQAIGGFDKVWPEFAKHNWNRKPVEEYRSWDSLPYEAPGRVYQLKLEGIVSAQKVPIKTDLPRLSATYHYFRFEGESIRSVVFWNGITKNLALRDMTGFLGPQYVPDDAAPEKTKGAHITALIKMGESWKEEDWTDRHFITYCRDLRSERIDELVLIVSNSEFRQRDHRLQPPGLEPFVHVSNFGCWRWVGKATFTAPLAPGPGTFKGTADVIWTRADASGLPFAIEYSGDGQFAWSVTAPGCTDSGVSALGIANLRTNNFPPFENQRYRTYEVSGHSGELSVCGATGSIPWLFPPPMPIGSGIPFGRFLKVSADGKSLKDSNPQGEAVWSWDFKLERQE